MQQRVMDDVTTPPTLTGAAGRAWQIDLDAAYAAKGLSRQNDSGAVAEWIIEAPWAHPIWHSYGLTLIHLRPYPGLKGKTVFHLVDATHELWLDSLAADASRQEMIETGDLKRMSPSNFAAQFIAHDDAAAEARIREAAEAVIAGRLHPDSDYRAMWAARFGDNMLRR